MPFLIMVFFEDNCLEQTILRLFSLLVLCHYVI